MKKELPAKPLGRRADASSYPSREVRDPLPTSVSSDKVGKGDSQKVSLVLRGAFGEANQTQKLDQLQNLSSKVQGMVASTSTSWFGGYPTLSQGARNPTRVHTHIRIHMCLLSPRSSATQILILSVFLWFHFPKTLFKETHIVAHLLCSIHKQRNFFKRWLYKNISLKITWRRWTNFVWFWVGGQDYPWHTLSKKPKIAAHCSPSCFWASTSELSPKWCKPSWSTAVRAQGTNQTLRSSDLWSQRALW